VANKTKAEHWRSCAADALATAEEMTHEETKATLLSIAEGYHRMAEEAEKHRVALGEMEAKTFAHQALVDRHK
jgi:hypothetical protein